MRESDNYVLKHDLSSLRVLGSVGEPINPEAWIWYFKTVGKEKCPIVDTWWQTETGGILVSPIPYATPLKPGSAAFPFFGVKAKVVREDGSECKPNEGGFLVIEKPWPGMIRTVFGQPKRLKETYFSKFPAVYFAGDGARVDEDGYIWFLGRVDDVLKVSGHRIGTAELESAFVQHPSVTEAAVVGFPHEIKGEGIYAFLTLKEGLKPDRNLRRELIQEITHSIGPIAKPDHIQFTPALPKTRSGKIMRRILRKIAAGDTDQIGDVSTLADSDIVKELLIGSRAIREEN
jgi:acetyl-CoA synthetase